MLRRQLHILVSGTTGCSTSVTRQHLRRICSTSLRHQEPQHKPANASSAPAGATQAVIGQTKVPVDEDGIPLTPPYSVAGFLDSLPRPSISDEQYIHLHKLAALSHPERGTPGFASKKSALEEMVRLVEGVRLSSEEAAARANEGTAEDAHIPDGRIWPQGEGMQLDWDVILKPRRRSKGALSQVASSPAPGEPSGKDILELASEKVAGYYVVKRKQVSDAE